MLWIVIAVIAGFLILAIGGLAAAAWRTKRRDVYEHSPTKLDAVGALGVIYGTALRALVNRKRGNTRELDADSRRGEIARLAVRTVTTVYRGKMRALFARGRRRAEIRERSAERAAAEFARTMGEMKGLAMKMGQVGSFMLNLSKDAEAELIKLQANVPPMAYDDVVQTLKADFGDDVLERFADFDPQPIAAASIGQVHRAVLDDGREVVIKVQYPTVREAVLSDLDNYLLLYRVTALMGGSNYGAVVRDIGRALQEEISYELEAKNQRYFADRYRGHVKIKIPEVIDEFSSDRVLTSEYVRGRTLYQLVDESADVVNRYGTTVYEFAFESILSGVFSGDPHPGNYLFLDDGRVCFLDFGFVGRLDERGKELVRAPVAAALAGDRTALLEGLRGLGLVPAKGKVNLDKLWDETRPLLFGPIDEPQPFELTRDWFSAALRRTQKMTAEIQKMRKAAVVPEFFTILFRYTAGTVAVLARMGCSADWRALLSDLAAADSETVA